MMTCSTGSPGVGHVPRRRSPTCHAPTCRILSESGCTSAAPRCAGHCFGAAPGPRLRRSPCARDAQLFVGEPLLAPVDGPAMGSCCPGAGGLPASRTAAAPASPAPASRCSSRAAGRGTPPGSARGQGSRRILSAWRPPRTPAPPPPPPCVRPRAPRSSAASPGAAAFSAEEGGRPSAAFFSFLLLQCLGFPPFSSSFFLLLAGFLAVSSAPFVVMPSPSSDTLSVAALVKGLPTLPPSAKPRCSRPWSWSGPCAPPPPCPPRASVFEALEPKSTSRPKPSSKLQRRPPHPRLLLLPQRVRPVVAVHGHAQP